MNNQEDTFQSASNLCAVQTVPVDSIPYCFSKTNQSVNKNDENVGWKYTTIKNPTNSSKFQSSYYKKHHRNISFKQERADTDFKSEYFVTEEKQQQIQQSSLFYNYQKQTQIYRKRYNFGTSWIGKHHYFASIFVNPQCYATKQQKFQFQKHSPEEDTISPNLPCIFDSEFESGNLFAVYKVGNYEYDLILQNDINTKGNTQWFYFRVKNLPKNQNVKINIVNLQKTDSLFNYGMKPCIFSLLEWKKAKKGWTRGGTHIRYFRNNNLVQSTNKYYYTLTFIISTPHQHDVLRVAQNYPYTTLDLQKYLQNVGKFKSKTGLLELECIATTIGKNKIHCITLNQTKKMVVNKNKSLIFILARQHPGQTVSSFVCEGLINFMTNNSKQSQFLRKNYEIKVIPMVNPDGVFMGNYRTNLFGYDLNRKWDGKKTKLPHQSYMIKKFLGKIAANRKVAFVLDLHGHSRKIFSFFYGNFCDISPINAKIFPYICSKLAPNYIKFQDCQFANDPSKRNTARVQLNLSFKCPNVFTYETSFYGYANKNGIKQHFNPDSYRELGSILCRAIYNHEKGRQDSKITFDNKEINLYLAALNQLRIKKFSEKSKQQQDSGSDSNPDRYELQENEQQKLMSCKRYVSLQISKIIDCKKVSISKRKSEYFSKSPRQRKFLQIARVSSIFPQNKVALIPDSYISQNSKLFESIQVQTDSNNWIQSKQAQRTDEKKHSNSNIFNPFASNSFSKINSGILSSILEKKVKQNKFISNKCFTSKDQTIGNKLFKTNGFRSFSQRKEYQSHKKEIEKIQIKLKHQSQKAKRQKAVQTIVDHKQQEQSQSDIRNTATSSQEPKKQIFDRKYITVYNQFKYQKQKNRNSRFSTINQLYSKHSNDVK